MNYEKETQRELACETMAKEYPEIHDAIVGRVGLDVAILIWWDFVELMQEEAADDQKET